jgi:DNA-binding IclR family transcriptional regulator
VTAKALAVLEALLWGFHNARTGLCFPSLASLAERAECARSTVQKALETLETLGLLSWVHHRLVRRREHGPGGWRWRVLRTSNGYRLTDPREPARPSDTEKRSETTIQVFHSIKADKAGKAKPSHLLLPTLDAALERLRGRIQAQAT